MATTSLSASIKTRREIYTSFQRSRVDIKFVMGTLTIVVTYFVKQNQQISIKRIHISCLSVKQETKQHAPVNLFFRG